MEWVNNQTLFFFYLAFPIALECYSEHRLLCSGNDTKSCVWLPVPFTNHEKLFHGAPCHQKMQPCSTKNKQFSVNRGRMPRMFAQRSLTAGTWVTWTCWLEGKFEEQLNFEDHNDFQILLISTVNLNSKIDVIFHNFLTVIVPGTFSCSGKIIVSAV